MEPVLLQSVLKDYIWGGKRLINEFGKSGNDTHVAESWELSCHSAGNSVIKNGEYKNMSLHEWITIMGNDVLGEKAKNYENFPILIKLIDANDNLSLQVHPDDSYALIHEGEYGKNEMWYIVDCEPGATIIVGWNRNVTKEELQNRIKDNTLLELCEKIPVKKGDAFYIEAGTIHAIGKGVLIAEVQQNSNLTYRIYDYGRKDANGHQRELHIEKAFDVINLVPNKIIKVSSEELEREETRQRELVNCNYFNVREINIRDEILLICNQQSFQSILVLEGEGYLSHQEKNLKLVKGDSVFIPAGLGNYKVNGKMKVLLTTL